MKYVYPDTTSLPIPNWRLLLSFNPLSFIVNSLLSWRPSKLEEKMQSINTATKATPQRRIVDAEHATSLGSSKGYRHVRSPCTRYGVLGVQFHLQINDPLDSFNEAQTASRDTCGWSTPLPMTALRVGSADRLYWYWNQAQYWLVIFLLVFMDTLGYFVLIWSMLYLAQNLKSLCCLFILCSAIYVYELKTENNYLTFQGWKAGGDVPMYLTPYCMHTEKVGR